MMNAGYQPPPASCNHIFQSKNNIIDLATTNQEEARNIINALQTRVFQLNDLMGEFVYTQKEVQDELLRW